MTGPWNVYQLWVSTHGNGNEDLIQDGLSWEDRCEQVAQWRARYGDQIREEGRDSNLTLRGVFGDIDNVTWRWVRA